MNVSSKAVPSQVVASSAVSTQPNPSQTELDTQLPVKPNREVFGKPPSAQKKRQLEAALPPGALVIVDEVITTHQGRTYGALFSEPIPEPLNLVLEPSTPIKSWKLWAHGLFTTLSLFAVCLGLTPPVFATNSFGAIDFSPPTDVPSGEDSFYPPPSPELSPEPAPEFPAEPAPETKRAPATPQVPELAQAEQPPAEAGDSFPQADSPATSPSPFIFPDPLPAEPATPPTAAPANRSPDVLSFSPFAAPSSAPTPATPNPATTPPAPSTPSAPNASQLGDIFRGGAESLVARTVGHAEGTRNPDGSKTRAFQGHSDPGNGVWNLGSFSFQHCREYGCSTAEQADVHQLNRLKGQTEKLRQRMAALGIEMSLLEELNGIDLANQAPLAALGQPGYPEWLKKARDQGLRGEEAILWARVSSYWDPSRNGWNAPGLGNTESRIEHDQNRRLTAIARALDIYQQQVAAGKIPHAQPGQKVAAALPQEQTANSIIFQDLVN